jgi:hypothetical protein
VVSPPSSSPTDTPAVASAAPASRRRYAAVVAMLVLGIAAVGASALLAERQADELRTEARGTWEERLAAVATRQRDFLLQTARGDLSAVEQITESPTVGLFLTEYRVQRGDFDLIMDGVEQLDYIRNYLAVVAAEHGYQTGEALPAVRANLPSLVQPADLEVPETEALDATDLILREFAFEGIALANLSGDVIVATDDFPPLTYAIRDFITTAPRGERHLSIAFDAPDGRPTLVTLHPAFAYLDVPDADTQLAWVVGLRLLEEVLDTSLLPRQGVDTYGVASVAVHRSGDGLRALSRLDDATRGGAVVLSPEQAPAWALAMDSPGSVGVVRGFDGRQVLTASAGFEEVPVSIVTSIPVEEALAPLDRPIQAMRWQLVPVIALAAAAIAVAWLASRAPRRPA